MNNISLIDKLVVLTDLAQAQADCSWDFEKIEKIQEYEDQLIEYLDMRINYFNVWDIVSFPEGIQHYKVIETSLKEDWNWEPWLAVSIRCLSDWELYKSLEKDLILIKRG